MLNEIAARPDPIIVDGKVSCVRLRSGQQLAGVTRLTDLEDAHALTRAEIACLVVREAQSVPDSYRDRLVLTPL
jgi:hypothetical protein